MKKHSFNKITIVVFVIWTGYIIYNISNIIKQVGFLPGLIIYLFGLLLFCGSTLFFTMRQKKNRPKFVKSRQDFASSDFKPSAKPSKHLTFHLAGVTFPCYKDGDFLRQDEISDISVNDTIHLEEYQYKGKPAYLVVPDKTDIDIGVVPAHVAEMISNEYAFHKAEGYIKKIEEVESDNPKFDYVEVVDIKLYLISQRELDKLNQK